MGNQRDYGLRFSYSGPYFWSMHNWDWPKHETNKKSKLALEVINTVLRNVIIIFLRVVTNEKQPKDSTTGKSGS